MEIEVVIKIEGNSTKYTLVDGILMAQDPDFGGWSDPYETDPRGEQGAIHGNIRSLLERAEVKFS